MTGWFAISLGDPTGIGPEVTLKSVDAVLASEAARFLLIGDGDRLRSLHRRMALSWDLCPYEDRARSKAGRVFFHNPLKESLPADLVAGAPVAARAAVSWLRDGAERCLRGEVDALITAPVNKEAIVRSGQRFIGQTEFLSEMAGANRTAMMLLGRDERERWLRVVLATTHVPLNQVASHVTASKVELAIELAARACEWLGLPRARVAVCGLNPHAGEGGQMGTEEQTVIGPAVEAMRARRVDVIGPLSADTLFYYAYRGDYDVVVAMYHDQGLVPLKMIGFETGVNWTLGLPFIRTSPDHGTAYDIAGQDKANPSSMLSAIRLAKQLAKTAAK